MFIIPAKTQAVLRFCLWLVCQKKGMISAAFLTSMKIVLRTFVIVIFMGLFILFSFEKKITPEFFQLSVIWFLLASFVLALVFFPPNLRLVIKRISKDLSVKPNVLRFCFNFCVNLSVLSFLFLTLMILTPKIVMHAAFPALVFLVINLNLKMSKIVQRIISSAFFYLSLIFISLGASMVFFESLNSELINDLVDIDGVSVSSHLIIILLLRQLAGNFSGIHRNINTLLSLNNDYFLKEKNNRK